MVQTYGCKNKTSKKRKQISHQNKRKEVNLGSVAICVIRRDSTMLFGPYDILNIIVDSMNAGPVLQLTQRHKKLSK